MSWRWCRPRHSTCAPGGGSFLQSWYPPSRAIHLTASSMLASALFGLCRYLCFAHVISTSHSSGSSHCVAADSGCCLPASQSTSSLQATTMSKLSAHCSFANVRSCRLSLWHPLLSVRWNTSMPHRPIFHASRLPLNERVIARLEL